MTTNRQNEWWEPDTYIKYFGGAAHVQAWGTVAGKRFHFRVRHSAWSFAIALAPSVDPAKMGAGSGGFFVEETYRSNNDVSYMSPEDAEAIIRRCAALFHEPVIREGAFVRQTRGKGYYARVDICIDLAASVQSVAVRCDGPAASTQQDALFDVPAEGFERWKQGAVAGIAYALARVGNPLIGVTVTRIRGHLTDTNASIVGAAAISAAWAALKVKPDAGEALQMMQRTLASWERSDDTPPNWSMDEAPD